MYLLTKRHYQSYHDVPILVSHDNCSGPYSMEATLPFANDSKAGDFVMRHCLGELKNGDLGLSCDEGADLQEYCLAYLLQRVNNEVRQMAKFIAKLDARGIPYEKFIPS